MSTQFFRIYMAPYEEIEQSYMLELLDEWVICIIFFSNCFWTGRLVMVYLKDSVGKKVTLFVGGGVIVLEKYSYSVANRGVQSRTTIE